MINGYHRPPPEGGPIRQPRFKTLQSDPALLKLESILRQINRWDDPTVQQHMRLARFGIGSGKTRGLTTLLSIVEDYRAKTVAYQDPFMPYATDDQIGNGGRGVHVLDQANGGVLFRVEPDMFLLDALILGRQGGGKSSAAINLVRQISTPVLIIDPKDSWRHHAAALGAGILEVASLDLTPPPGGTWEDCSV